MKKINTLLFLIIVFVSQHIKAQQEVNFGDFAKPVPSVSSLATYSNTPISNATGLPDVSFPLLGLSTYNNGVSLNIGLSYNPINVSQSEPASQTGTGWSLFAGGVISRSIENDIDEINDYVSNGDFFKNDFDDIYYYNLPGISGKFRFKRNTTTNTFELINFTSNKVKIEYTRSSNTTTLILESFTITDSKGTKYIFNDYSRSNQQRNIFSQEGKVYKSAFFLTQIKDANNVELANFTYQKDIKYKYDNVVISYQACKLKTITSPGFGKIEFDYSYEAAMENTYNDPYQLQKVMLKDNYNHIISQYTFDYSYYPYYYSQEPGNIADYKRVLSKIKKISKNNTISEITAFEYSGIPYSETIGLPFFTSSGYMGILKKVINPSGGVVEYNFEVGDSYKDRTDPTYMSTILANENFIDSEVQYYDVTSNIGFDTNQTTNYTFTISGTAVKRIFVVMGDVATYPLPPTWESDATPYVDYMIKDSNQMIASWNSNIVNGISSREYMLDPGTYTLQITGSGGSGTASFYGLTHSPPPFKNYVKGGIRIGSIKYYNSQNETNPVKVTNFNYKTFTDDNASSGYYVSPDMDSNAMQNIIYKNVKITNVNDDNGYTKYYYKIPEDFPKEPYVVNGLNKEFLPYYNFTSSGLLDKKEVYNSQNKILVSEHTDYTFDYVPGAQDFALPTGNYSKLGWLKKSINTSTSYFDNNQSIEEQSETNFNIFNFEVASTKKVIDGSTVEQIYTYPESGYANLSNAHIMNVPVIIENKTDGTVVSKTETKFDNPNKTLPTSLIVTNIANDTKTSTIDLYDEVGNAIQFTSPTGMPTTVIYGYDKTSPIAKIEGATYAQVSPYIQAIVTASNADSQNSATETDFLTTLDNFRKTDQLKNFQITTYTYDPLIGATTVTPPNGIRAIYKYDADNRLQKIVDMNGVTLKEYQYNYKN